MIAAADVVASARPAARARSCSPGTTSPVVANLAGLKNWPAALRTNTTRYTAASHTPTGRARTGTNDSPVRPATIAARITSVRIIVDFRFHRSTKTPAIGPTRANAAPAATRIPPTAAGAQHQRRAEDAVPERGNGLAVPQLCVIPVNQRMLQRREVYFVIAVNALLSAVFAYWCHCCHTFCSGC